LLAAAALWAAPAVSEPLEPVPVDPDARPLAVPQDHPRGALIRGVLKGITLPEGFTISLYALVPGARHMAVAPDGTVVVGTTADRAWLVFERDGDGRAEEVRAFAPGLALDMPNGPCFGPDGTLYLAERNRVLAFPGAALALGRPQLPALALVPQGRLIPPEEESGSHSARVCRVGPDGMIYVSLGQPYNVAPPDKLALYDEWGIGGIIRLTADGTGREVFTRGIRNSVGHDFHPSTGELWFTDNQVDGMGDDIPPGELNRQTAPGQHFGFPWYGGGDVRSHDYEGSDPPDGAVFPAVGMVAHAADLGMTFYRGTAFPGRYRHAIFSAQHGSWDRSEPIGARVMVTVIAPDGSAAAQPFAEGWIAPDGSYNGRPVDVAELPDGSLLVSDDHAGAIYRIAWGG
jgi:glucose/arabinose dehydrogenase